VARPTAGVPGPIILDRARAGAPVMFPGRATSGGRNGHELPGLVRGLIDQFAVWREHARRGRLRVTEGGLL